MTRKFALTALCLAAIVSCGKQEQWNPGGPNDGKGEDEPQSQTEEPRQEDAVAAVTFNAWPAYDPGISYDFSEDYGTFEMPQKNMTSGFGKEGWRVDDRWFTFVAGPDANPLVTENGVKPMLEQLNTDFQYLREEMGWVPDRNAQEGYRSAVYLYGSGLDTDDEPNTATGGWQGSLYIGGEEYPMLLLSYYPVYCFDPECTYSDKDYHTYNVTHEGIHCLFSSMPGGKKASWFNEGCNTWLQTAMNLRRGTFSYSSVDLGWLSSGSVLAPFIPIECYGGWRTDGSFGPPDWNLTMSGDSRNIVGGIQYSSLFATFLEIALGDPAHKWIWQHCKKYVLEGLVDALGEDQVRRMILEYRARLCLCDFGDYSSALTELETNYFGTTISSEGTSKCDSWDMTPYIKVIGTTGTSWLTPEERTLPGWTGANVLPVTVDGGSATVFFDPLDSEDLACMVCYRTKNGKCVYTEPFTKGGVTVDFGSDKPSNGVMFLLVCNTTYKYGASSRTKHYNYKVALGDGCTGTASPAKNWYLWNKSI